MLHFVSFWVLFVMKMREEKQIFVFELQVGFVCAVESCKIYLMKATHFVLWIDQVLAVLTRHVMALLG